MSVEDADTPENSYLSAYFGFGYEPEDEVDAKLAEIKRKRTVRRVASVVLLVAFGFVFLNALDAVGFSIAKMEQQWPEFEEALPRYFPTQTLFTIGPLSVPMLDFGAYAEFLTRNSSTFVLVLPFTIPILDINAYFITYPTIVNKAIITLAMGFAGTVLGVPGALLFGVLGSERVTPFPFNFIFRGIMSTIRSIPALIWALIYIPLGGLSPFTATLAIGTDTIGNLGRLFTDALEEVEDGPIEAIESTGATRPQTIVFGMLSQVFTPFIAWTMYILEINVRIAVTMGLIGAGGIGGVLNTQRGLFAYTNMMATIFVIFVLVVSVEMISQRTRSRLRAENDGERKGFFEHLFELIRGFPNRMINSAWK